MIGPLGDGDYYTALCQALDVIEPVCRGEYSYADYKKEGRQGLWFLLAFICLIVILCILGDRYSRKHPHNNDGDGFSGGSGGTGSSRGGIWGGFFPGGGASWGGGSWGGSSGGGFGGFGGGSFGGGGAHGRF